jgi:hypothetical protein
MYEIYGSPGFLAAYDAGPGRLNSYMNDHNTLPGETINYVAMIAPNIQGYYPAHRSDADELALNTLPMTEAPGILPPGFVPEAPSPASLETPDAPVQLASAAPVMDSGPAIYTSSSVVVGTAPLPPSPAPVPQAPVQAMLAASALATPQIASLPPPLPPEPPQRHSFSVIPEAMADTPPPSPVRPFAPSYVGEEPVARATHHSGWAIQVGAYDTSSNARAALGIAELSAVQMLMGAQPMVMSVHAAGHTKYRARFVGLVREDAVNACNRLAAGPTGCVVVPPEAQS